MRNSIRVVDLASETLRGLPSTGTVFAMVGPLAKLEHEIRALGTAEKKVLLRVLWEELDGQRDTEVESVWLTEVQRRTSEIESGAVETVPSRGSFR